MQSIAENYSSKRRRKLRANPKWIASSTYLKAAGKQSWKRALSEVGNAQDRRLHVQRAQPDSLGDVTAHAALCRPMSVYWLNIWLTMWIATDCSCVTTIKHCNDISCVFVYLPVFYDGQFGPRCPESSLRSSVEFTPVEVQLLCCRNTKVKWENITFTFYLSGSIKALKVFWFFFRWDKIDTNTFFLIEIAQLC